MLVEDVARDEDRFGLHGDASAYSLSTLLAAATGTTTACILSVLIALVHHPEWQRKMQEEVDQVVGCKRLPSFSDIPSLLIVRAVVKETMRWRDPDIGGIPHMSIKDDVYDGFFIPAGSLIHFNAWLVSTPTVLHT